jgi:hypothetical protein
MPSEYTINGTITFDEYLECHKILAGTRRLWVRCIITIYGIGACIYGMLVPGSSPSVALMIIGAFFAAYGIFISPIQFRFRVKRNWDRYPQMKKEFNITILEDGLQTIDDKGNPSHTAWDSFLRFQESESLFLLYLSPLLPLCVPKRLIHEDDRDGLRSLLSASVGKQSNREQDAPYNGG